MFFVDLENLYLFYFFSKPFQILSHLKCQSARKLNVCLSNVIGDLVLFLVHNQAPFLHRLLFCWNGTDVCRQELLETVSSDSEFSLNEIQCGTLHDRLNQTCTYTPDHVTNWLIRCRWFRSRFCFFVFRGFFASLKNRRTST